MVDSIVKIDAALRGVVEALAEIRGMTVDEVVRELTPEALDDLKARLKNPLIGFLRSREGDISERDEEILYRGWQPD